MERETGFEPYFLPDSSMFIGVYKRSLDEIFQKVPRYGQVFVAIRRAFCDDSAILQGGG